MLATVILAIFVTIRILIYISLKRCQKHNFLPGPWGLPIFGHLPFLGTNPGVTILKWAKTYGPIFSIKFGSIPIVVLNDAKIIKEAFQLDSFGGRPLLQNFVAFSDRKGILFSNGPFQTEQRKFVMQAFKTNGFRKSDLEFHIREEIDNFLQGVKNKLRLATGHVNDTKENSEKFTVHHFFQIPLLNSVWMSVMGRRFSEDDPTLEKLTKLLEKAADTNSSVLTQMSWFFPWVAHALTFFGKNHAVSGLQTIYSFIGHQMEDSKETYVPGEPKSITHAYFDQVAHTHNCNSSFYNGQEQRFTIGDIFIAASDTTTLSLDWLLLYMAREPRVQEKLQQEIDEVLGLESNGESRLPTLLDRPKMPYTEAVILELFRISSVVPLGVFHQTLQIVNFHGYIIPMDTMIISNLYGIHHDPEIWSQPDLFQPERFLESSNKAENFNSSKLAGLVLPFSSGKRNCIGEGFARDQMFLIMTHFFQKFTVSCTEKKPSLKPVFGFVMTPLPFQILISERIRFNYC